MFTHSRDGRQPAPEGLFAPPRQMLADGEDPDGGADALVWHRGTTTARSRLRSGVERVTHHDVASCQLQARTLEVAPEELKITTPRTGDRPRAGGRWDRAVVHGGGAAASGVQWQCWRRDGEGREGGSWPSGWHSRPGCRVQSLPSRPGNRTQRALPCRQGNGDRMLPVRPGNRWHRCYPADATAR